VTVLEGIQKSAEFLAKKEVDSPRLQAELLLGHVLKLPRMKLYLEFDRNLTPAQVDQLRELVRRRGRREPFQQIIGCVSFCGLEIAVSTDVLIPRPETELLAEAGWTFLSTLGAEASTALDFGTGSGCIAVTLAVKCPATRICATDISQAALTVAGQNAARLQVAERIRFLCGDGFAALGEASESLLAQRGALLNRRGDVPPAFDLIISNPPYIPTAEIDELQPEVRDYDPRLALDGGGDGLDYFHRLAAEGRRHLKPAGRLMVECGDGQAGAVGEILRQQNWVVEAVREDYTQHPRILIAKPD
jgi:release factor glutamine methyltransferase